MSSLSHQLEQFMDNILNAEQNSGNPRFSIYRNNWRAGLIKALSHTYPVCKKLLGQAFFEGMAFRYVENHFSRSFSLNDYGSQFYEFIKTFGPASEIPYLADVAELEWLVHRTLLSPAYPQNNLLKFSEMMNQAGLGGAPKGVPGTATERLSARSSFDLKISVNGYLIQSPYPIHRIWEVNQPDYAEDPIVHLDQGQALLFVRQQDLALQMVSLPKLEWELLSKLQNSGDLMHVTEALIEELEEQEANTQSTSKYIDVPTGAASSGHSLVGDMLIHFSISGYISLF